MFIFFYKLGQTLGSLTSVKPNMQSLLVLLASCLAESPNTPHVFISQFQQMISSLQTKKTNVYSLRFYLSLHISIGQSQVLQTLKRLITKNINI